MFCKDWHVLKLLLAAVIIFRLISFAWQARIEKNFQIILFSDKYKKDLAFYKYAGRLFQQVFPVFL